MWLLGSRIYSWARINGRFITMKVIFLDTNIFIQCREIEQLPWGELFEKEKHIILVIPRTVLEEIDRFKQEGNSRRAKRARKANSFIESNSFRRH